MYALALSLFITAVTCWSPRSGQYYSAIYENNVWSIVEGKSGVAYGAWTFQRYQTGWDRLDLFTDGKSPDATQAYAAGFLEGAITQVSSWQTIYNYNNTLNPQFLPSEVVAFVKQNDEWMQSMASAHGATDPYWFQVNLVLEQTRGLVDGYNLNAPEDQKVDRLTMLCFQLNNELDDIARGVVKKAERLENARKGIVETWEKIVGRTVDSHCSVLVRVSEDGKDLFSSHVTWAHYGSMLRLYKFYTFNFQHQSTSASLISFASYPAQLYSGDDYYLTNQKLVITETTNDVFNSSLFLTGIKTDTVPFWIRVMVASRMARGGQDWNQDFYRYNSGTYNNQWQVVDYKQFVPGKPVSQNTLWISEQLPGYFIAQDKSDYLIKQNHWPSYNVPYYPFIYNISGYPSAFAKYGNAYSYTKCPRAQIFARDQGKVNTFDEYKKIMRYNRYQEDDLSLHNACNGVSARCDLNVPWQPFTYFPFGGSDGKVTNNELMQSFTTHAVSGPSWDDQPPFSWTEQWESASLHEGHPKVFAFYWEVMSPAS